MNKYLLTGILVALCSVIAFGAGAYFVLSMYGHHDIVWNSYTLFYINATFYVICGVGFAIFFLLALLLVIISFLYSRLISVVSIFPTSFRLSALICYWLSAACAAGLLLAHVGVSYGDQSIFIAGGGVLLAVVLLRVACASLSVRTQSSRVHSGVRWVARIAFGISLVVTIPIAALIGFIVLLALTFTL